MRFRDLERVNEHHRDPMAYAWPRGRHSLDKPSTPVLTLVVVCRRERASWRQEDVSERTHGIPRRV